MRGRKIRQEKRDAVRAMLRAGKSYKVISDTVDISVGAVHSIAREASEVDLTRMVYEIKRGNVARHLMMADFLMGELASAVRTNTSVKDLAIAAAIMTDKAMLLEKLEEKRAKVKNLELQVGATVPSELVAPLPKELDVVHDFEPEPDHEETNKLISEIKQEMEREKLDIEQ